MATKSFTASAAYPNMQLKLDLSSTVNVAENKSTVSWSLYLYVVTAGNYNYSNGNSVNCTLNGTAYINTANIRAISISGLPAGSKVSLGSGSFDVSHSSDGTKSISVSASFIQTQNANASYSISGTFTLDNIARASQPTLSSSSVALGSAVTITTNRASSSFTHTLKYKFGSATGTIATGVGASTSWTPPASLASQIPNSTSGSCTITCTTYSGSTSVGSKTVTLTLTVPNNSTYNPTLSLTLAEPSNHTTTYGGYVQNKSKFQITASPGYKYGATLASLTVSANGTSYTMSASSLTVTTNVLTKSGTNTVTATLKDSRGRSVTATASASVQAYTAPTISTLTATRCDSSGNADDGGSYMKISISASITALGNKNGKTFTLQYKKTTDSAYTTHATYTSGYSYTSAPVIAAETNSSYEIKLTATDSFGSTTKSRSVSTAFTLIDFHSSGKGIAFGKVSEEENLLESKFKAKIREMINVEVDNTIRAILSASGLELKNTSGNTVAKYAASGDTMTPGAIYTYGKTSATDGNPGSVLGYGNIELCYDQPFIDFHFGNSTDNYTSRIQETAAGVLTCSGKFVASNVGNDASLLYDSGYLTAGSSSSMTYASATLSDDYTKYRFVLVLCGYYASVSTSILVPSSVFATFNSSSTRCELFAANYNASYAVRATLYSTNGTSIMIGTNTNSANYKVRIYGIN